MTKYEDLQKKLFLNKESSWHNYNQKEVFKFADDYKKFLGESKTERLAVKNIVSTLTKSGFKSIEKFNSLKQGDKVYKLFKNKVVLALIVGKNKEDLRIVGSHVDSPRLDLKPRPLYEDSELALMKTHYYGGVKKYHWVNEPLSLIGVIFTKQGKKVEISIGEKDTDPVFTIPDLLIHLSRDNMEKKAKDVVQGEELNILVGNIPVKDEKIKEKVKLSVLEYLNKEYGIIEEDFTAAELELVPAQRPREIGFDKSMIGGYGQDDRVCVYTSLRALIDLKNPKQTSMAVFFDKEETGSNGDTGAAGFLLKNISEEYCEKAKLKISSSVLLENAKALSADVTAAINPNYKDVHEINNVSYLGRGVSIEKYGGSGGKYSSQDAHAEYMSEIRMILDKENIPWQSGELGKIDCGGGGTIAKFLGQYGMDCVDVGPCILAMHSPFEVSSKADVFSAYRLYKAFLS